MLQLQSAFGVLALLAIAWAISENRGAVSLKQAAVGLAVTFLTALALIKLPFVAHAFSIINDAVGAIAMIDKERSVDVVAGADRPITTSTLRSLSTHNAQCTTHNAQSYARLSIMMRSSAASMCPASASCCRISSARCADRAGL